MFINLTFWGSLEVPEECLGNTDYVDSFGKVQRGISMFNYAKSSRGCQTSLVGIDQCCIFRPALGCCALQTLVKIVIFSVFCAKKPKKQKICSKILQVQVC